MVQRGLLRKRHSDSGVSLHIGEHQPAQIKANGETRGRSPRYPSECTP
jgi:hypothetical protein